MTTFQKIWKNGWRIVVCLLLLGWIFHVIFLNEAKLSQNKIDWDHLSKWQQWQAAWKFGPSELWHTLASVDGGAFLLSLALVALAIILGIIRWRMILRVQGLELSFVRATEISLVAQFFNSFLLGSTGGDLIKAYYAARETHHKKTEAVTTVFVDRIVGLWSMLFFAALMMVPNLNLLHANRLLEATALLILAMLAGCTVLLWLAFWGGISKRWPSARVFLRKLPKGPILERSLESCRQFGAHRGFLLKTSLISLALNIVCVLQAAILAYGLNLHISLTALFAIVPIIVCISALPITPSGLGVRENLFVLMLAVPTISVASTSALSLSLLIFAGSLFWSIIGGIVYLCLKDRQHLNEITQEQPPETLS